MHEQPNNPDLSGNELAQLQCRLHAARFAAALLAEPSGKWGRPASGDLGLSDVEGAVQAPLRPTTGLVASPLKHVGLDCSVPDFSTMSRRQKNQNLAIPYRPGTRSLPLLIDNTGIKAKGEGEWFAQKHRLSKPCKWCTVHLGIDAVPSEIGAVEVTDSRCADVTRTDQPDTR